MGKKRQVKEQVVAELKETLGQKDLILFADYRGLKVSEITELRNRLRQTGVTFQVVKNTLAHLAAQSVGLSDAMEGFLAGPTAMAVAEEVIATPARVLQDFAKEHKALELKGGLLNGQAITVEQIKELADLPGREELLARVLAGMQAPLTNTVGVLQGILRNLVYVLDAVRKVKESA